jgi:hypothetical protein
VFVVLRYVEGCASWVAAHALLREVLDSTGHTDVVVRLERVGSPEEAGRLSFVGSPTILVDGRDPFEVPGAMAGLACRLYRTPDGLRGVPTREQLVDALR